MKSIALTVLALVAGVLGLPTNNIDYSKLDYSHVDYKSLDYSHVDYSKIDFRKLDYSHIDYSKVNWSKVDYSSVDWSKVPYVHQPVDSPYKEHWQPSKNDEQASKDDNRKDNFLIPFTSTFHIVATPDQVVNASNQSTGGLSGALGYYSFGINSELDLICYFIRLQGFKGEYQSPARTATHIHQADKGKNGPPRIAFPNPKEVSGKDYRVSAGCISGPFVTGLNSTQGIDTGTGFSVQQIEEDPSNFFADVHSSLAVPGAVRGQFA